MTTLLEEPLYGESSQLAELNAEASSDLAAQMDVKAAEASALLARMANPQRLRILCLMVDSEVSVNSIAETTGLAQPAVSQHLRKLRDAGVVETRRDAQTIYYSLSDPATTQVLQTLYGIYCAQTER
jgi:DNA-binding transcriptional ArsR family regulator